MSILNKRLRLELDLPTAITYEVVHLWNTDIELSIANHSDSSTRRVSVPSVAVLRGDDYQTLLAIEENTALRCEKIPARFYNRRTGTQLPVGAYVTMNRCAFNKRECKVDVRFSIDDPVTCWDENKSKQNNFLLVPNPVTVSGVVGTIQTVVSIVTPCTFLPPTIPADVTAYILNLTLPGQVGWRETLIVGTNIVQGAMWTGDFQVTFKRERVTGSVTQPPGLGWINLGGGEWVREPRVVEIFDELTNLVFTNDEYYQHWLIVAEGDIDNGRTLKDTLEFFSPCGMPVVSDFFGINPVGDAPTNSAYTEALDTMQDVVLFQKSDILRPFVSNNATIQKTTAESLMNYLRAIHNVDFRIENVGGVNRWRIEHWSFFNDAQTVTLDITQPRWADALKRKDNYVWNTDTNPGIERFYWGDNVSSNFDGYDIIYGSGCTNSEQSKDYRTAVTTDLAYAQAYPTRLADEGFFMLACDLFGTDHIIIEDNIPSLFGTFFNAPLSYRYLHFYFWRHGRFAESGQMNNALTTFLSTVRRRQQEQIELRGFCLTDFEAWDINGLVRSQLGDCEYTATYSVVNSTLTLNLTL